MNRYCSFSISYKPYIREIILPSFIALSYPTRALSVFNRKTDKRTDRWTEGRTDVARLSHILSRPRIYTLWCLRLIYQHIKYGMSYLIYPQSFFEGGYYEFKHLDTSPILFSTDRWTNISRTI